jgi:hypothetical protein
MLKTELNVCCVPIFLFSPKKFGGTYCRRCVLPSVRPSSYFLNLSSEIDVVDTCNKSSLIHGLMDQGLSRSFWKVQGHSEHIKEKCNFHISSYYMYLVIIKDIQKLQAICTGIALSFDGFSSIS